MIKRNSLVWVQVIGVLVAACGNEHLSVGDLGGVDASRDGSQGAAGVGGATGTGAGGAGAGTAGSGAGGSETTDSGATDATPAGVVCAGVTCGAGQDCCLLDGRCFDLNDATACPRPPDVIEEPGGRRIPGCGANTHCNPSEFCERVGAICLGPGACDSRTPRPDGNAGFAVCGCNGVTYPDTRAARAAGTRNFSWAGCGQTLFTVDAAPGPVLCGFDSQCPSGQKCCAITGRCYDTTKPGLCAFPPTGTLLPCLKDSDCSVKTVGDFGSCLGTGCAEGPGGCGVTEGFCELERPAPVCGCNGQNYMNAKCAYADRVRVLHDGYCSDAEAPDAN